MNNKFDPPILYFLTRLAGVGLKFQKGIVYVAFGLLTKSHQSTKSLETAKMDCI